MDGLYLLAALDGADEDGGTLYVLYDDDGHGWVPLKVASVPQPLERYAATMGRAIRRVFPAASSSYDHLADD